MKKSCLNGKSRANNENHVCIMGKSVFETRASANMAW